MEFPFVIQKFNLKPFSFLSIIENVILHQPDLPCVVVKHLTNIEERILDQLAWEEDSPLLLLMQDAANREHVQEHIKRQTLNPQPRQQSMFWLLPVSSTTFLSYF